MSVCVVVCLVRLYVAQRWTRDLSRVYPAFRPMTAGISSSPTDGLDGIKNGWMDVYSKGGPFL